VTTTEPIVSLETMNEAQIRSLGRLLEQVFDRLDAQLGNFDFNLSIDHPPMHRSFDTMHLFDEIDRMCRFALHITPRIYRHGGFELSEETMINPVTPEDASARLRADRVNE
jgi:UDPglucose--hexose-1-phosphate uridylyltransferase